MKSRLLPKQRKVKLCQHLKLTAWNLKLKIFVRLKSKSQIKV